MGSEGEQLLIVRAKRGDDAAYEQLLAMVIEPAHKLACGLLQDSHLAEDVVQEAAVRAWRKLKNLRDGASIAPWFLGIVANQCREVQRGHWSRIIVSGEVVEAQASTDDSTIARIELRRRLQELSRQELLVVVLHFYLDLSWPDITAVSGLSEPAARSRLYRALEKLRAKARAVVAT